MIIIFGSILPFSNEKVARYYVYNIDAIRSTVKSVTQTAYSKKQTSNITYQVNTGNQHSGGDQLETRAYNLQGISRFQRRQVSDYPNPSQLSFHV